MDYSRVPCLGADQKTRGSGNEIGVVWKENIWWVFRVKPGPEWLSWDNLRPQGVSLEGGDEVGPGTT